LEGRVLFAAHYEVTNLVSDGAVPANHLDGNLVNGWGLAHGFSGPWVVASNGAGKAVTYDAQGVSQPPNDVSLGADAAPTGVVFNGDNTFFMTIHGQRRPARFVFATEEGTLIGLNDNDAAVAVDRSAQGAIYKGITMANLNGHDMLYATDFHNGRVDVFNERFQKITLSGNFTDRKLPAGFAPYGVQYINGKIYVSFAKQDEDAEDEVEGAGLGAVDVFSKTGKLVRRLAKGGTLNAGWGMAQAPSDFGPFSNDILVGNFGDGRISAFSTDGHFKGLLRDSSGDPVEVDELWGIGFGNGSTAGPKNTLFFVAGPNEEENGLFGSIKATT
jgi:uncharacterized protein (TIGR03118 family)